MDDGRRQTLFLMRVLMLLLLTIGAWYVLEQLAVVLAPVGVALVLAFLLDPSVRDLEARGVPRFLAVALMVLGFLAIMVALVFALPHLVQSEIERFVAKLPLYEGLINRWVMPSLGKLVKGQRLVTLHDWGRLVSDRLGEWIRGAAGQISTAAGSALSGVAGILRVVLAVLLVPIFAVSFLMDMPNLVERVRSVVPPRHQQLASDIVKDVYVALAGWLRGQLTVMLIQAALYSIGLSLCGISLAVVIGCTAGMLAFVPYVGVSIGLLAALISALVDVATRGAAPVLGVLVTFLTVQVMDALFITPRAVGGRIGLSAVGVIFALSLGGHLLGYAGLLLAVPVAAVLKALGPRLFQAYTATRFYTGNSHEEVPTDVQQPPG